MVNEFKSLGYDVMCFHTDMKVHADKDEDLQYWWGLVLASRFHMLPLTPLAKKQA